MGGSLRGMYSSMLFSSRRFTWVVLSEGCTRRCNSPLGGATRSHVVSVARQRDIYLIRPRVYSQAGRPWVPVGPHSPERGRQRQKCMIQSVCSKFNFGSTYI